MTIEAVVFDFDGLIVDTESAWYDAWVAVYRNYGLELPQEVWMRCVGTSFDEFNPFTYLEEKIQKPIDREATQKFTEEQHALVMQDRDIRPGVEDYLRSAQSLGLKIGLASSSTRSWVTGFLERYGLLQYFSCIRTADDVSKVKPDPELYVQALACLGVAANQAVAFEDSAHGANAAIAAGLKCVIVPNALTASLTFPDYDLRLASMADRPLADVLAELSQKVAD
ncbi:HAD family hydrolase [Paenibacillus sp. GCM10027626]|uniref:HAD family hydrolase n=1 Tax=Paenibacillus sp. GCM10027626 TaxID=3273411 RepID=UPI0036455211